ncbi:MAG: acyl-CoA thioesterase [Planctomycetes bacterium]|nr:acyl-CoA thioesterase [Planctomycetota bacterium]
MTRAPHEHRLRVRYGETDQMGVVHHANYLLYFEEGRTRMMADLGAPYSEVEKQGWALPVRKVQMRFRQSARYDDELIVRTRVGRVGAASVEFLYDIVAAESGQVLASGSTELACIDLRSPERRVAMLPESLRSLFGDGEDAKS